METTSFKHGYNSENISVNVDNMTGYSRCLKSIFNYLAEKTQYKPENRMIDALELLDIIDVTNHELMGILKEHTLLLQNQNLIPS